MRDAERLRNTSESDPRAADKDPALIDEVR
jgi:hypothetical protein